MAKKERPPEPTRERPLAGGSYVRGKDGKLTLAHRTEQAAAEPPGTALPEQPEEGKTT